MPELPDIAAYLSALEPRIVGRALQRVRLPSAFVLRTAEPPVTQLEGQIVRDLRRIGKRIEVSRATFIHFVRPSPLKIAR